jgi:hypothetical protein
MEIGIIDGCTRRMGKPDDGPWTDETCDVLAIKDMETPMGNVMVSEWVPSQEERDRIAAGMPIHLWVYGTGHPPVSITVGEPA